MHKLLIQIFVNDIINLLLSDFIDIKIERGDEHNERFKR